MFSHPSPIHSPIYSLIHSLSSTLCLLYQWLSHLNAINTWVVVCKQVPQQPIPQTTLPPIPESPVAQAAPQPIAPPSPIPQTPSQTPVPQLPPAPEVSLTTPRPSLEPLGTHENPMVNDVRKGFFTLVAKDPNRFHPKDIEQMRVSTWWAERFANVYKTYKEAIKELVNTMEWRKAFGIYNLNRANFPEQITKSREFKCNYSELNYRWKIH